VPDMEGALLVATPSVPGLSGESGAANSLFRERCALKGEPLVLPALPIPLALTPVTLADRLVTGSLPPAPIAPSVDTAEGLFVKSPAAAPVTAANADAAAVVRAAEGGEEV
jgi:hypothetical protein